ncbi:hypothetical protein JQM83_13410 [Parabacteroides distasonis]|nr:hypothetical protein [Parabacteroides distasonis]
MQLTPHFTLEEFEYSSTALARGIDNRIPNRPSATTRSPGSSSRTHSTSHSAGSSAANGSEVGSVTNDSAVHPAFHFAGGSSSPKHAAGSSSATNGSSIDEEAKNSPILANIQNLCEVVLEPLRQQVNEPVIISSGYRCPQLNRAVGGSPTSQHMTGEACDIHHSDPQKLRDWFAILQRGEFDQLIWERSSPRSTHYWIHVSCKRDRSQNRRQVFQLVKGE